MEDIQKAKDAYNVLAFVHQKLLSTNYFPEEFKVADAALKMITDMCNQMAQDIESRENHEKADKTE